MGLKADAVGENDNLAALGIDSMQLMEVRAVMQKKLCRPIPLEMIGSLTVATLRELAAEGGSKGGRSSAPPAEVPFHHMAHTPIHFASQCIMQPQAPDVMQHPVVCLAKATRKLYSDAFLRLPAQALPMCAERILFLDRRRRRQKRQVLQGSLPRRRPRQQLQRLCRRSPSWRPRSRRRPRRLPSRRTQSARASHRSSRLSRQTCTVLMMLRLPLCPPYLPPQQQHRHHQQQPCL